MGLSEIRAYLPFEAEACSWKNCIKIRVSVSSLRLLLRTTCLGADHGCNGQKGVERVNKLRTHILEVERNRAQGVCFEHSPKLPGFLFRFRAIHFEDESDTLH